MSLTGKTLASTYKDLLQVDNSNNGVGSSTKTIKDGNGSSSAVSISDDHLHIKPVNDNTTTTLYVRKENGDEVFSVDTSNELIKAVGNTVNTQYAYFGTDNTDSAVYAINTHQAIPFSASGNVGNPLYPPAFGTNTEPLTYFTTADSNGARASDLVPMMWFVPDAISIDSVTSIEGADDANGDTTRMHLYKFNYSNASSNVLTGGTLLAHNSDVTNAGSEQLYKSSWTVDSSDVASGSVILAFFRSDSINSDYSINVIVKYHLT